MIAAKELRELLDYNPETGMLIWRVREVTHHRIKIWNKKFAGKRTGYENNRGYLTVIVNWKSYLAHRLAWLYMTGSWPSGAIDHKNMNKADNRWSNLREATSSQNGQNRTAFANCTSGHKGVCLDRETGKWRTRIVVRGKRIHGGRFDTKAAAAAAYAALAHKHFGEFARP